MSTPLSDIQEVIERTIFESIRAQLVDKGYLPDITTFPDTEAGEQSFISAKERVKVDKGFCIDLFNESSNHSVGMKAIPRIVIKSGNFLQGDLGGDPRKFFVQDNNTYKAMVTPPQTTSFFINVHLVSNSVQQERILNAILSLSLPKRKYLKHYNAPNLSFFIRSINYFELDDNDQGIIEKVQAYEVPDCWDTEDIEIETGIAKMLEITVNPMLQKYMDGDIGNPSDPLVVS